MFRKSEVVTSLESAAFHKKSGKESGKSREKVEKKVGKKSRKKSGKKSGKKSRKKSGKKLEGAKKVETEKIERKM